MKFEFYNPTRVVFGPGEFARAGRLAVGIGKKCLLVIGGGSVERHGYLQKLQAMLKDAGVESVLFRGIEPNPHLETCIKAAKQAREAACDFVLGLGGGSVMDACKAIAVGFYDPDNLWDYINHGQEQLKRPQKALPIMLIPTLAATGSEMDAGGVITRWETREKCVLVSPLLFPKLSLIDPELTVTVPLNYTMDGVFDMAVHVLESYFNGDGDAPLQMHIIEGFVRTVFEEGAKLYRQPENVKLRENVQWPSSLALSGFFTAGLASRGAPVHQLEHPLSAHWDISHGRGLALLMPRWMWYVLDADPPRFARFAIEVMGVMKRADDVDTARAGVVALTEWLDSVGLYLTLSDLGIPEDELEKPARDAVRIYGGKKQAVGGVKPLRYEDCLAIYRMCAGKGFMD